MSGAQGPSATNLPRSGIQSDSLFGSPPSRFRAASSWLEPMASIVLVNHELERQFGYATR